MVVRLNGRLSQPLRTEGPYFFIYSYMISRHIHQHTKRICPRSRLKQSNPPPTNHTHPPAAPQSSAPSISAQPPSKWTKHTKKLPQLYLLVRCATSIPQSTDVLAAIRAPAPLIAAEHTKSVDRSQFAMESEIGQSFAR